MCCCRCHAVYQKLVVQPKYRNLQTQAIKLLVIDEADEMLNRGFKDQIYDIYRYLPPLQVALISATMPQEVLDMTKLFMNEPIKVLVQRDELTLEGIKQFFVSIEKEEWKFDRLFRGSVSRS